MPRSPKASAYALAGALALFAAAAPDACAQASGGSAAKRVNFEQHVLPIFKSKCFECHREAHQDGGKMVEPKGGLAMDSAAGLVQGEVIAKGHPEQSELYVRLVLPKGDDDLMPPIKEGGPLSSREIAIVKLWIEEGASFGGWQGARAAVAKAPGGEDAPLLPSNIKIDPAAAQALQSMGGTAVPIGPGNPLLLVEFISYQSKIGDAEVAALEPLADVIGELDLSRTKITDSALETVAKFKKLQRLNLNSTAITDAGVAKLEGLTDLTYLNLYGTQIGDGAMESIAKLRKLEKIYVWKTSVSNKAIDQVASSMTETKITKDVSGEDDPFGLKKDLKPKLGD